MFSRYLTSELSKATIIVFSGSAVSAAFAFVMNAVLARSLGPSDYGVLSSTLILMNILIQVSDLGTGKTVIRMASAHEEFNIEKGEVYTFAFYLRGITCLLLAVSTYAAAECFPDFLRSYHVDAGYTKIASVGVFLGAVGQTFVFMMQENEDYLACSINKILMATAKLLLLVLIVYFSFIDIYRAVAITLVSFAVGLIHSCSYSRKVFKYKNKLSLKSAKIIFDYFKWITVVQVASIIIMNAPGIVLTVFSTSSEVGYFYAAFNISLGLSILSESLLVVLMPKMSKVSNIGNMRAMISNITKKMTVFVVPCLILIIFSEFVIRIIYGHKYSQSAIIMNILIVSVLIDIMAVAYSTALYQLREIHYASIDSIVRLIVLYVLGVILVEQFGAIGIAIAILTNTVLSTCFRYSIVRKNLCVEQTC